MKLADKLLLDACNRDREILFRAARMAEEEMHKAGWHEQKGTSQSSAYAAVRLAIKQNEIGWTDE